MNTLRFPEQKLKSLEGDPARRVLGEINGVLYTLQTAVPDYAQQIAAHYTQNDIGVLREICRRAKIPFDYTFFGLVCRFEEALELDLYNEDMVLDENVRVLIERFGPITIKNAYLKAGQRDEGHRAKFQHLNFHYDRAPHQAEQHSLYIRDPFDPEQAAPRQSSTLFIANIVACLQSMKEAGLGEAPEGQGVLSRYHIFEHEDVPALVGRIIAEHRWDEPHGTGEISILDNRTALHASYYRNTTKTSYRIGVRYLK